jgi:hypothetical protein
MRQTVHSEIKRAMRILRRAVEAAEATLTRIKVNSRCLKRVLSKQYIPGCAECATDGSPEGKGRIIIAI